MVPVRNIYHMLSYCFDRRSGIEVGRSDLDRFSGPLDLIADLLCTTLESLVQKGLGRSYTATREDLSMPRGRMDIGASVARQTVARKRLVCVFDEYTVDTWENRIIKAALLAVMRSHRITDDLAPRIKRLLRFFESVGPCDLAQVNWSRVSLRAGKNYRLSIFFSSLIGRGLIMTDDPDGRYFSKWFDESAMPVIYERFLLGYYRREHPQLRAGNPYIPWDVSFGKDELLPVMKSDLMLWREIECLIVDAKYYGSSTAESFGRRRHHSGNLYQMFTYIKNWQTHEAREGRETRVAGMLLYAKSDDSTELNSEYVLDGSPLKVRTLDLSLPFDEVRGQLDAIADGF